MATSSIGSPRALRTTHERVSRPSHRARAAERQHPFLRVLSAPRSAADRSCAEGRRPRRSHLLPAGGAHRPRRRRFGRVRRHLDDHLDRAGRLRAGRQAADRRSARDHRRPAPDVRARRRPSARRLRRPWRRWRRPHARAHRGARRQARARGHPSGCRSGATGTPCTTSCANAAPTSTPSRYPTSHSS